jgi:hypothetical protein
MASIAGESGEIRVGEGLLRDGEGVRGTALGDRWEGD